MPRRSTSAPPSPARHEAPPSPARHEAQQSITELLVQLTPRKLQAALACDTPTTRTFASSLREHVAAVNKALPPRQPRTPRVGRSVALVNSRVHTIENAVSEPPVSKEEYCTLLLTGEAHMTAEERETTALCRLVRGYEGEEDTAQAEWYNHIHRQLSVPEGVIDLDSFSHGRGDVLQWATKRHVALQNHNSTSKTAAFAHHVIETLAAIEFSMIWEEQGRKWKSAALAELFQAEHGDADGFETWKHKFGKTTTARNKLAELYRKFGPHVLLDPHWSTHSLHPNHRSETYTAVTEARLFVDMPKDPENNVPTANSRFAVNAMVTNAVLYAIDKDLANWFYKFGQQHPSDAGSF